jgi:hypothetical protein
VRVGSPEHECKIESLIARALYRILLDDKWLESARLKRVLRALKGRCTSGRSVEWGHKRDLSLIDPTQHWKPVAGIKHL